VRSDRSVQPPSAPRCPDYGRKRNRSLKPRLTAWRSALSIKLSNVSNDSRTSSTHQYDLYHPSGLAASEANKPPVVLIAGGSGGAGNQPGLVAPVTTIGRKSSNPFDVVGSAIDSASMMLL
jgi:hypothetical protein